MWLKKLYIYIFVDFLIKFIYNYYFNTQCIGQSDCEATRAVISAKENRIGQTVWWSGWSGESGWTGGNAVDPLTPRPVTHVFHALLHFFLVAILQVIKPTQLKLLLLDPRLIKLQLWFLCETVQLTAWEISTSSCDGSLHALGTIIGNVAEFCLKAQLLWELSSCSWQKKC